jgi:integrase
VKKWDRGPEYRWDNGVVECREIERKDLVKDQIRVRGRYTKEDGRPGTFDALNWRAARDEADKIKKRLEEGRAARSKSPTFERVWKEWNESREEDGLAPATRTLDGQRGRYLVQQFGKEPIDSILPIDAEHWLKKLCKSKPVLAHGCKIQLGQVCKFAKRKKYLTFNPIREDPIKLPPEERERPWVPSWDPMDRIINRGQGKRPATSRGYTRVGWSNMRTVVALAGGAGLRISEVVALRWESVDFANGVLHIHEASTSRGVTRPKKNKIRDVPTTQWVYDALFEHMHVLKSVGIDPKGLVIYNRQNLGRPTTRCKWNTNLKRFLRYAGIDREDEWHIHVFRRFYISARYALGHRELDILEAVAHEDSKVTKKHYARALPEPPPIWRYRFRPAEPDDQTKVIDGVGAVVGDCLPQLPAPEGDGVGDAWAHEARRLLDGGWKIPEVMRHVRRSRAAMARAFKRLGWSSPAEIYRAARDRRFEAMDKEGDAPIDIWTRTGVSKSAFYYWREARDAGIAATTKSLKELRESRRPQGSVATDRRQQQLSFLESGAKSMT